MSFGDKVIDLFMPTKKESQQNSEPAVNKHKPEVEDFTKLIDRDSLHSLFPFSWEQYPTYVQSGENFIRVLAIADYPKRVYGNWLSELKRKKGVIDIVQYIDSASNNSMITYYKKTIQNKEAQKLNTFDPYKKKILQNYIDSANMQLDKYLDNSTTFVYQHMLVYLRANSLAELDDLTENVKNTLIKLQMKPLVPVKATFQAFWSTMPINENLMGDYTYKESNTEVASSMFPFDDAEILANQQKFVAKLDPYQRFKDETGLMTFMQAKHVQKGSQGGLIKDVQKQAKKSASPQLFSLSSLQSAMNKRYHASASQTLAAIQSLYEAKLLSYPRTDCAYITDEEFEYLVANLTKYLGLVSKQVALTNTTPNKRYVNGKKVEEHYAIIMTKVVPTKEKLASLPKLQQQVYDLVLRTTLAMFADPYEYEETTIITQVGDANFKATGKVPTKQGWQALFDDHKADQQEATTLPLVHQGDQVQANLKTPQKETTPPVPFTEGTLITAMKTAGKTLDDEEAQAILKDVQGIGTSATRANVLEVLKKHGYLVTEKNKLHVSEAGITLCKAVELEPLLTSPEMTAKWEQALQQISTEERTPDNFLNQIKKFVEKLIADVPTQLTGSAAIKQQIDHQQQAQKVAEVFLETPQATVLNKQKFYIVKPKQGEDFTIPKKWSSKTLGKTAIKALVTKGETSKLKGFKSKKGKSFDAKLKLEGHKLSFDFD